MTKKWALLDENGVVIQTQPHIQPDEANMGFVIVPGDVVCGMVKQGDAYVTPEQPAVDEPDPE